MARCGCSDACTCSVTGTGGITVTGDGSTGNPYVIDGTGAGGGGGATVLDVQTITTDTTIDDTYDVVLVDSETPGTPVEITLPLAVTAGKHLGIKDYGAGGAGFTQTQAVTVNPNGNSIDGSVATSIFPTDGDSLTLVGTGTDWAVV